MWTAILIFLFASAFIDIVYVLIGAAVIYGILIMWSYTLPFLIGAAIILPILGAILIPIEKYLTNFFRRMDAETARKRYAINLIKKYEKKVRERVLERNPNISKKELEDIVNDHKRKAVKELRDKGYKI